MLEIYEKIRSKYRADMIRQHLPKLQSYNEVYLMQYIDALDLSSSSKYVLSRALADYLYTFSKITKEQAERLRSAFRYMRSDWSKQVVSDEQIDYLIKIIERQRGEHVQLRNKLALAIMLTTGCRIGELLNMKTNDICVDEQQQIVIKLVNSKSGGTKLYHIKATHSINNLNILTLYNEYINKRTVNSEYLFSNDKGQRITKENIEVLFRKADMHPHQIRHTAITKRLKDYDIYEAAKFAGHKSLNTTQRYIQREYANVIG